MKFKNILLPIFGIILTACSSWELKDRCQATNWFNYSQNLSFQGKYLEEDGFIKECRGVDRINDVQLDLGFKLGREKMCTYDEIKTRAAHGEPVFFKFCDGLEMPLMKRKFQEGLAIFCTADQGYSYGKEGHVYQNVCAAPQELQFLPSYYKGRKEYLTQFLVDHQEQLKAKTAAVQGLLESEADAARAYYSIPNVLDCHSVSVYNEAAKREEQKTVCSEPFYIQMQRQNLYQALTSVQGSLSQGRKEQNDILSQVQWAQQEMQLIPLK